MKRFAFVLFLLALLAPAVAFAQTSEVTIGQPFSFAVDANGTDTVGYRLFIDNAKVGSDLPLSTLQSGSVTVPANLSLPSLNTRGSHTFQIAAFNEDNEVKSDPLVFTIKKKAPGKPTNPKILITAQLASDGRIEFVITELDDEGQIVSTRVATR